MHSLKALDEKAYDILDTTAAICAMVALAGLGVFIVLAIIYAFNNGDTDAAALKAYCTSIEGSYGGGKCYKDGQEMKP